MDKPWDEPKRVAARVTEWLLTSREARSLTDCEVAASIRAAVVELERTERRLAQLAAIEDEMVERGLPPPKL